MVALAPIAGAQSTSDPLEQTVVSPSGSPATAYPADSTVPASAATTATAAPDDVIIPGQPASKPQQRYTLWDIIKRGGYCMYPLGALSLIGTTLVLVFIFTLRRSSVVSPRYMATVDALLRKKDYLGLLAVSNRHNEAVARIVQRTLDFATKNPTATYEQVREIAETEGTRQSSALQQQITYLADIGGIAPMIGLLGTVTGMIKSFTVLAGDAAISRANVLAEGISEALIATAAGLFIGIPAMAFYAFFRGRVQRLTADLESAATQVLSILALHYAAVTGGTKRVQREELVTDEEF